MPPRTAARRLLRAMALAAALLFGALPAAAQDFDIGGPYRDAFARMTSGDAPGGAALLVEAFRTCPGNDAALTDRLVGPAQLLGFAIASLMDWPERNAMKDTVMKPDEFEFDRLLIAAMEASSGMDVLALPAYIKLAVLSKSDHEAIRLTALYIMAEPYFYRAFPTSRPPSAR